MSKPELLVTTSPFVKSGDDTAAIMWQVNFSLVPVIAAAVYLFGLSALLVTGACIAGTLLPEWLSARKSRSAHNPIRDGSALITGILLALTLPPGIPLWMAFLGGVVAIVLGKMIFGGIGSNMFNPALVGRAFLQAAFPTALTSWVPHQVSDTFAQIPASTLSLPLAKPEIDGITAATPLANMKFDAHLTDIQEIFLGSTAGSLGETSSVMILLAGLYLGFKKIISWRIPVSIFVAVYAIAAIHHWVDPVKYPPAWFHLFSGGLMLGAIFMATDMVTSPVTPRGCLIFGFGIGVIAMIIRIYGGLPEGVMYAILLMNAAVPLINQRTQPRVYGTGKTVVAGNPA